MYQKTPSEPLSEPLFKVKMLYSEVKLFIPKKQVNGRSIADLSKRWYVYYSYRNPRTNKMQRIKEYRGINKYNTVSNRRNYGNNLRLAIMRWLRDGYTPFGHISETTVQNKFTFIQAIDHAIEEKLKVWSGNTKVNNLSHCNVFKEWIETHQLAKLNIKKIKKRHISEFLNDLTSVTGRNTSATNRNNYRSTIHSLFTILVNDDIIDLNFISQIPKLEATITKNKAFTPDQIKKILKYLDEYDPYLKKYIQFIMYAFLRPVEVTRIKVGEIDLQNNTINVKTKTEENETVLIIDKLKCVIDDMLKDGADPSNNLFSNEFKPKDWITSRERSKTDFFIRKFRILKNRLNLGKEYGLYSFRHTVTLDLYNSFLKENLSSLEAKQKLMAITRHKSMSGLENYLRGIGAKLPKDYSDRYSIKF